MISLFSGSGKTVYGKNLEDFLRNAEAQLCSSSATPEGSTREGPKSEPPQQAPQSEPPQQTPQSKPQQAPNGSRKVEFIEELHFPDGELYIIIRFITVIFFKRNSCCWSNIWSLMYVKLSPVI